MIRERFTTTGEVDLDISCSSGTVTIERSATDDVVEVEIDTKHPDGWTITQSGCCIEVGYSKSGWGRGGNARIRVTAPAGCNAKVATASADVVLRVDTARTDLKTASGDVRVDSAHSLTVKTASGDVTAGDVANDFTVSTASGDVAVGTVFGELVITTASGDARIARAAGRARFSTASGDVRVERFEGTSFTANAMSGDITIGVPTGRNVDFDAKTLSGRVEYPEPRPAGSEAPVGEPVWVSLVAKSVSGDIRLRRAE
ncbi:MAG TPA: DUF4097 family beta strand repeat-containing protein [Ilumatobacter sp.]|nr:DUF4097 family beta strand repeat-containing protein [Ilumatobacter sp.]